MIHEKVSLTGMTRKDLIFILILTIVASGFAYSVISFAQEQEMIDTTYILEEEYAQASASLSSSSFTQSHMDMATSSNVSVSQATFRTSRGDITVSLFVDKAPETVKNFITLASQGFYNGTKFHRIIPDFMIQGGDPLSKDDTAKARWGTGGPGYSFADEINNEKLVQGVLAMANAGPNTNGSQFFIVTADATPWLDGHHTAFGKVISGMDVVTAIGNTATDNSDKPIEPIVIESIVLK